MDETPNKPTGTYPVPPPPAGWTSASNDSRSEPWQKSAEGAPESPPQNAGRADAEAPPAQTTEIPRADTTSVFGTPAPAPATGMAEPKRRRVPALIAGLAIGALLGGGAGAGVATWMNDDDSPPAATNSQDSGSTDGSGSVEPAVSLDSVADVADQVQPSVVSITAPTQMGVAGGSGVILSADGEILTNNHVVEGAQSLTVTFSDGTMAEAEVVATDPMMDLAVIKAQDVSGLTPARLGDSGELAVGEQVVAIGSPLGLEGTVTTGIVSSVQRPVAAGGQGQGGSQSFIDAVQTDAPINPGNSGGPLVNMAGEVVGINTAIYTDGTSQGSIGLGFAIPIDQAKPIVDELRNGQAPTHARLGVEIGPPQDGSRGAAIRGVVSGTAADEAGFQTGDIVTKVNDRLIVDSTELIAATRSFRPGDTVTVTYTRDGEEHTTEVTLGSDAQST